MHIVHVYTTSGYGLNCNGKILSRGKMKRLKMTASKTKQSETIMKRGADQEQKISTSCVENKEADSTTSTEVPVKCPQHLLAPYGSKQ